MEQKRSFHFKLNRYDIAFAAGMFAIFVLYLYKVRFEIQGYDEAFYLTIPQRLLQGDVFVKNEWHGSQLAALLVVPFMAARNLFFHSNDGILLQFRYIYVFTHAAVSVLLYSRLKKYGSPSVIAALLFFLFTPYSITALCYNTIGLAMVCLSMAFLTAASRKFDYAFAGAFFSAGVLCCPFLLLAFVIGLAIVTVCFVIKKNKDLIFRTVYFVVGCLPLMIILLGFILSKISLQEFIKSIPYLLSDPEHPSYTIMGHIKNYIFSFADFKYEGVCCFALLFACLTDRNRNKRKTVYFCLSVMLTMVMLIHCLHMGLFLTYNYIMFPISFAGLMAFCLTEEKDLRLFMFMYAGSFAYSFCINMASNQRLYVISDALTIAAAASVIFIFKFLKETVSNAKVGSRQIVLIAMAAGMFLTQFAFMGYVKVNHKFWSRSKNSELTEVIDQGPYAGIHVTKRTKAGYDKKHNNITEAIPGENGKNVLFFCKDTWYYLNYPNLRNSAYSAWLSGVSDTAIDRLASYYELNPDKIPDHIYIPDPDNVNLEYFSQKILKGNYEIIHEKAYAVMYLKN